MALAAEQYAALGSLQGAYIPTLSISIDELLGLTAQTMGDPDQAMIHFEEALDFCRQAGYRPALAWSCCDYAEALIERDGTGDKARAIDLLNESMSITSELGMRPLSERAGVIKALAESGPSRPPEFPAGLTQREVEVLRLISGGKTDREIGGELFISVKTVGNHVSNILNKTHSANRTEAATFANQHGLVTPDADEG